ncbi:hypothetical protein P691DRAFT_767401 [Macrolepiota fuliginosa MF-IS2]|uniref:Uncharacterized protein n=1 Tax=Macrolepiota fuliginosa MF-IS2 TaxID=1400762 RepID=A0A9P5WYH4_9AGAR|nr:hypothetical protein P691DRAFT_767401 [Macrolepiota fuliginosa MF-IS2]
MLFSKTDSITLVLTLLSTFYIAAYVRHKRSPNSDCRILGACDVSLRRVCIIHTRSPPGSRRL